MPNKTAQDPVALKITINLALSAGWELAGLDRALEKEMAIHSSKLVQKIPWTMEPGRLQSMGLQKIRTHLSNETRLGLARLGSTWTNKLTRAHCQHGKCRGTRGHAQAHKLMLSLHQISPGILLAKQVKWPSPKLRTGDMYFSFSGRNYKVTCQKVLVQRSKDN